MSINTLRVIVTLLAFAAFIGIVIWACSRRNKKRFAEAAQLPFLESAPPASAHTTPKAPPEAKTREPRHG